MRSLAMVLLLIWLPLQGVAAAVMPFCDHQQAPVGSGDHHTDHHLAGHGPLDHSAASGTCDDCGVCHLACAPTVPSQATLPAVFLSAQRAAFECGAPPAFIPDLPQRPPLPRT
jgi:hypothetical protein